MTYGSMLHVERRVSGLRVRRHFVARVAATLSLVFASMAVAQDSSKVEIQSFDLGSGLHMLVGRGGNIAVSTGPDGTFLVDDQYAPLTPGIVEAVARLTPKPIEFVLNTHWHGDHTGGNENLAKGGTRVVAHERVRARMIEGQFNELLQREIPPATAAALPVVTFDSSIQFHLNGETIRALHIPPAHTDGDSIVYFEGANVVHMGDTYFNGLYPFVDLQSGGSVDGVLTAVEQVLTQIDDETKVVPGHGPLSNRKELADYFDMLSSVRRAVRQAQAAGKSREEVVASRPTAEYDAKWGGGFLSADQFVGIVYQSVAAGH